MNANELIQRYADGERDFSGANLSEANLYEANLSEADLSGADLGRADLSGANLSHNKYLLTAILSDYPMTLSNGASVLVHAGCRCFSIADARAHWAEEQQDTWTHTTPEYGERQRSMLEFLVLQARGLGWEAE